jgi:hypothetical protein
MRSTYGVWGTFATALGFWGWIGLPLAILILVFGGASIWAFFKAMSKVPAGIPIWVVVVAVIALIIFWRKKQVVIMDR